VEDASFNNTLSRKETQMFGMTGRDWGFFGGGVAAGSLGTIVVRKVYGWIKNRPAKKEDKKAA